MERMTAAAIDKRRVISTRLCGCSLARASTPAACPTSPTSGRRYGLVYHYFSSKEEILDTLFLERWDVMLAAIAMRTRRSVSPRQALPIAAFIIESYRHDPELMKVIIVERHARGETRSAARTWKRSETPIVQIAAIVSRPAGRNLPTRDHARVRGARVLWMRGAVLTAGSFELAPIGDAELSGQRR